VPKRSSAVRGIRSRGVEGEEGTKPTLTRGWILGEGGFGRVHAARSDGDDAVAKLVPKDPGTEGDVLFVDLT
jgi:hypothetical protein